MVNKFVLQNCQLSHSNGIYLFMILLIIFLLNSYYVLCTTSVLWICTEYKNNKFHVQKEVDSLMNVTYAEVMSCWRDDSTKKLNLLMSLSYDSHLRMSAALKRKPMSQRDVFKAVDKEKHLFLINVKWHLIKLMWHKTIKCKTVVKANYLENWLCRMLASFITDL